ncbi:MAG: SH3 domain-containing protein [Chloroflexi bacterium]|nr:SH3 domain-containing protein [Chloroflexota bacterium]
MLTGKTRIWIWFIGFTLLVCIGLALAAGGARLLAQEQPLPACGEALPALWTLASEGCVARPEGYVCNGGSAPQVEPVGAGYALTSVGSLVDVASIDSIRSAPIALANGIAGLVWARVLPPVHMTALLIGDVYLQDVTPPDFATWQSLIVQTAPGLPSCAEAPRNLFLAQVVQDQTSIRLVINGISVDLVGTMAVYTTADSTVFVSLYGGVRVLALGSAQIGWAGQQVSVPYAGANLSAPAAAPNPAVAFDPTMLANIPTMLLDHVISVPQPGYVATQGTVNLRAAPSTGAALLIEVPPGQILSVLGSSPAGDWLHVQTSFGLTGWMFAELLQQNLGTLNSFYENTPTPIVRVGNPVLNATVIAPDGVNLRNAPDVSFAAIGILPFGTVVNLEARSPYSPWVRISANGSSGWVALIALETDTYIDALPIDFDVPPPPGPTRVPGSWGNAFPDPNRPGG